MNLNDHVEFLVEKLKNKHINEIEQILKNEYSAKTKQDNNLFIVSYDLIKTPFEKKGALALRGTIFELKENIFTGKIVCLPFYKFFNHGETLSFKGNPEDIKAIYSKEDGSLIKLYYHNDKWNVGSNNTTNAYNCVMESGKTLGELFDKAAEKHKLDYSLLNKDCIYCFELATPENRIVLKYNDYNLFHLMTRCMKTLDEIEHEIFIPKPENYNFKNLEQILLFLKNKTNTEGFVIVYNCGNRIKVKSEWYTLNHRMFTNITEKDLLEAILKGFIDDIISFYPEKQEQINNIKQKLINFEKQVDLFLNEYKISLPVSTEKRIELFKSGKIGKIKNSLISSTIKNLITNKITSCFENLNKNNFNDFLKQF